MSQNVIVDSAEKIYQFLEILFGQKDTRNKYLANPKDTLIDLELDEFTELWEKHSLFYRFISDDKIWGSILANDLTELNKNIELKFPELTREDIQGAAIALTNTFVVHDVLVGGQQIVLALSTLKVVAAVAGISNNKIR